MPGQIIALNNKFELSEKAADRREQQAENDVIRAYKESLKEIRSEVALNYEKYATAAGVLLMAEMMKYNRLSNLEKAIIAEVKKLYNGSTKTVKEAVKDVYQEAYYHTAWTMEIGSEVSLSFELLKPEAVEASILNPLDRITWPERVKDNAQVMIRQIREEITRGIIQGKAYNQTAKAVKERMDVGASKALRIVQTETHRAQSQGTQAAFEKATKSGVIFKRVWVSTLDGRTRDRHRSLDGQKVGIDEPFKYGSMQAMYPGGFGSPDMDINCFPGNMCVYSETQIYGATKRWYEGDLIEIVTATGIILTGTPNHPILTEQGWLPLNRVVEGCNVVCCTVAEPIVAANPYPYNRPITFGEAFGLADVIGTVFKQRARGVHPQFHGDGFDSDIDIVFFKSKLGDRIKSSLPKHFGQDQLTPAELGKGSLLGDSAFSHFLGSSPSPSDSAVSSSGESATFFGGSICHSNEHGFAAVAAANVVFQQNAANDGTTNIEGPGNGLFGSSSEISFDNVIAVNIRYFLGHVYNLQTDNSVYIANAIVPQKGRDFKGVIAHNCRCTVRAEIEGMEPDLRRARDPKTGKNVIGPNMTYEEWYIKLNN